MWSTRWKTLLADTDIRFVVDALPETGFGHAARCLALAEMVDATAPHPYILFEGRFSPGALARVKRCTAVRRIVDPNSTLTARVSVIDRMTDPADINVWDAELTERIAATSDATIAIFSGDRAPALPEAVRGIGYQPLDGDPPAGWRWGLDYAPVGSEFLADAGNSRDAQEDGLVLIAMGGATDPAATRDALAAAIETDAVRNIEVLVSPLLDGADALKDEFDSPNIVWRSQVDDVRPLLRRAAVVVTSYGNLGYEALAFGKPVCFLGQKPFQARMAARLAARGVAVSAGLAGEIGRDGIRRALSQTFANASELSHRSAALVDGRGLDRIRDAILEEFDDG